jgi:hypothetical protein
MPPLRRRAKSAAELDEVGVEWREEDCDRLSFSKRNSTRTCTRFSAHADLGAWTIVCLASLGFPSNQVSQTHACASAHLDAQSHLRAAGLWVSMHMCRSVHSCQAHCCLFAT